MPLANNKKPVVLVLSGHDPSGAAGIQADIEAIASNGCHSVSVITTTTAQNTTTFDKLFPTQPEYFTHQAELLLADINVHACKIGLMGSIVIAEEIAKLLNSLDNIPVVLDPVIASGTGTTLVNTEFQQVMINKIFPLTTILTPNSLEALKLTNTKDIHSAALKLNDYGCRNILITGADDNTSHVTNTFFPENEDPIVFEWERLPESYHGSGCTLSSSIAAFLAKGNDIKTAVTKAQKYTWDSLKNGMKLGKGQLHPNRFYKS